MSSGLIWEQEVAQIVAVWIGRMEHTLLFLGSYNKPSHLHLQPSSL